MAFAVARQCPAVEQQRDLAFAADEFHQALHVLRLKARLDAALTDHAPRLDRHSEALEIEPAQRLEHERLPYEPACVLGQHDLVRLCLRLQACREIRRLAAGRTFGRRGAGANFADDDQSRRDADASLQLGVASCPPCMKRLEQVQCRAHGSHWVVLVRPRITEVHEHPVAEELRDMAIVRGDRQPYRHVIAANELLQVLGIEPTCQRSRANQIAKHHGQLPSLGIARRHRHGRRGGAIQRGYRAEQPLAMSERGHAEGL